MEFTYCNLIAECRAEISRQGKTRKELGRQLNISPVYLSKKLNGSREFRIGELIKLAKSLGMEVSELYRHAEEAARKQEEETKHHE